MKYGTEIFLVLFYGSIGIGAIIAVVYPMHLCNQIKNQFELNEQMAIEKFEDGSFEEWIENSNMAMNEDCWWESNFDPSSVGWI